MKKLYSISVAVLCSTLAFAQTEQTFVNDQGQTITYSKATSFFKTPPLSEWGTASEAKTDEPDREIPINRRRNEFVNPDALPDGIDPALQTSPGTRAAAQTIVNVFGLAGNGIPPDPSGAAGPNHYVQAVNTSFRVYNKQGIPMSNTMSLSSLWPGSTNSGDPIVMYDRHADRWFISQFQIGSGEVLIAISETGDPTGSYFAYSFFLTQFPDYLKFSIWWNGYYMTSNSGLTAVSFERDKMLVGDQSAAVVALSAPSLNSAGFRSPLPADADGPLPPNGTPLYIFNLEDDGWAGVAQDRIKVWEMTTDWVTPSNTQVVVSQVIQTDPFDTNFGFGFDNISQPGTSQRIDAIPGVLMYRAQHMRWNGFNTMMLCHVVDVDGTNHAGMRWYELRDADDGNWSIFQQGTYAPDDGDRWMGSIAMDEQMNIGVAYSYVNAGAGEGAGLRFTGRLSYDAPGTMNLFETIAIDGNGAQNGTNRFGDYAHMTLDPDGSTLWYTGEYLTPVRRTRIFSFSIMDALTLGVEDIRPGSNIEINLSAFDNAIVVQANGLEKIENADLELIDLHGRVLESTSIGNGKETFNHSFGMGQYANGVYFVRVVSSEVQRVQRIAYSR